MSTLKFYIQLEQFVLYGRKPYRQNGTQLQGEIVYENELILEYNISTLHWSKSMLELRFPK